MRQVKTERAPAAIGPYAQAVEAGGFLFTSGQIPLRPDGSMAEGDIRAQVEQVLSNLDAILEAAGCRRTDVVKATIFLVNLGDFQVVNELYGAYFGDHRPARTTVQVAALPRGAGVEIEFVAVRDRNS
ncbi:MAG: RidA family protein [Alicyclobacillus sp.]|nr:RidA family protein [Alicyclobacillus sp.]